MKPNRLRIWTRLIIPSAVLVLAGCAGYQYHSDGMKLVSAGDHDAALGLLQEAVRADPSNAEFRIDLRNETTTYAAELVKRAEDARRNGQAAQAAELYVKALKVEPANDKARRGLLVLEFDARNAKLLTESEVLAREGRLDAAREKATLVLTIDPGNSAAQRQLLLIREQTEKVRDAKAAQSASLSVMSRPVTLQFRDANLRMVFEALSRTTGLNVILDRDVRADLKTTIFVKDAAVEDTVDLILLQNQLEKRSLNANTLFVYPATAAKQKEYQDLQVRTFQVLNADVKNLQTVLKTVLKVKDISMDERSGTLVIRDTPEAIAVAAKVIAAHDVAEPEVMLEVEVLEISRDRLQDLGLEFPDALTLSTPTDVTTVGALRALTRNQLLVTPLSLGINFKLQEGSTNILASPRIRARNKEKARILIGDRVPIITNSVTPLGTGTGVVTGTVTYQDVGLKLEFEPQVYSDQEVGIRISLEVSRIVKEIAGPQGSLAYQIGTRNAQTVVRLRDGETQVMGGLITSEDRNLQAKIPGLGRLPVVGVLFGNYNDTNVKTELVMSITPRILRPPAIVDPLVREVFSGTDGSIRQRALQLDPIGAVRIQSTGSVTAPVALPVRPAATPDSQAQPQSAVPSAVGGNSSGSTAPSDAAQPMRGVTQRINSARSSVATQQAPAPAPASAPASGPAPAVPATPTQEGKNPP